MKFWLLISNSPSAKYLIHATVYVHICARCFGQTKISIDLCLMATETLSCLTWLLGNPKAQGKQKNQLQLVIGFQVSFCFPWFASFSN